MAYEWSSLTTEVAELVDTTTDTTADTTPDTTIDTDVSTDTSAGTDEDAPTEEKVEKNTYFMLDGSRMIYKVTLTAADVLFE